MTGKKKNEKKERRNKTVNSGLVIICGSSHPALAKAIANDLDVPLGSAIVGRFPEGEIRVQIDENVRGRDVFIIQPTCAPSNDNLMELLILLDAAKRASARRITAVLPYYGYARQDRKDRPRVPITAKLVANLIVSAGASRVLTMDLHAGQIQGFFDIPVDHLYSINVLCEYFINKNLKNLVVVTPDVGGLKMARAYSKLLDAPFAIVDKRRESATQVKVMNIIGEVAGHNVVIVDDLVSTGSSLVEAAQALRDAGALDIYSAVVHPVLAGDAVEKIEHSVIREMVVSDSIPLPENKKSRKLKVISVAPLLAEAIKRIHDNESVSSLFAHSAVEA
ncbi:MAG: ribose-phosphate pyrophosphokinase [Omnitrophica bacterium GWA2_50_21]|nr:MAG: ribose-phosphate pyrophosphokinase [Omnitrophica bacterium GWA2_50_21]